MPEKTSAGFIAAIVICQGLIACNWGTASRTTSLIAVTIYPGGLVPEYCPSGYRAIHLIPPNQSPHTYEPGINDARQISNAQAGGADWLWIR